jgi:hypothetical protein
MRNLVNQTYRVDMETTKTKATAGPSTAQVAKNATCFAQDDNFLGV